MLLALATVGLLRLRHPRAALLCLLAHVAVSIQLVAMLNLVDDANYWDWLIWPTAAGAVMLLAARDRARDEAHGLPLRQGRVGGRQRCVGHQARHHRLRRGDERRLAEGREGRDAHDQAGIREGRERAEAADAAAPRSRARGSSSATGAP